MDEVDGMSAGDHGGSAELIQIIKKSQVPMYSFIILIIFSICICNDRQSPKIRTLANYCLDLKFRRYDIPMNNRPTTQQVEMRVKQIADAENLDLKANVVGELVQSTVN